jgi:hypothetical protein
MRNEICGLAEQAIDQEELVFGLRSVVTSKAMHRPTAAARQSIDFQESLPVGQNAPNVHGRSRQNARHRSFAPHSFLDCRHEHKPFNRAHAKFLQNRQTRQRQTSKAKTIYHWVSLWCGKGSHTWPGRTSAAFIAKVRRKKTAQRRLSGFAERASTRDACDGVVQPCLRRRAMKPTTPKPASISA